MAIGTIIGAANLATSALTGMSSFKGGRSAAKTPIGIGPLFSRLSGAQALEEAKAQADLQNKQAMLAYEEGLRGASARRREIESFKESQAAAFSSGGITLAGSPLAVLQETQGLGDQEVTAMQRAAEARSRLLEQDSLRILRMGQTQKFQGEAEALQSEYAFAQQKRQLKNQARTGALQGLGSIGTLSALGGYKAYNRLKPPKPPGT